MVAYTFMGGLWAVTVTDFVQFAISCRGRRWRLPALDRQGRRLGGYLGYAPAGMADFINEKYNWFYFSMLLGCTVFRGAAPTGT